MLETGEDLPFAAQATLLLLGGHVAADQLDGHPLAVLVVRPPGQVDDSHAPPPELSQQLEGADPAPGDRRRRLGVEQVRDSLEDRPFEPRQGPPVGVEQALDPGPGVAGAGPIQEGRALARGELDSLLEDALDAMPVVARHGAPRFRSTSSSARRSARLGPTSTPG